MASFTDATSILGSYNPYISQIPVDAYTSVGMQKQGMYDANVQQIQTTEDNIHNLPIAKKAVQQYVSGRLGELNTSLQKIAGADFSNNQLKNQIIGQASTIAKDPIVQNGILSTANYKKGISDMEDAKKQGKWSPANDYVFQKQAQDWLNDGKVDSSFNSSYTPYTDTDKIFHDELSTVHEDDLLNDASLMTRDGKIDSRALLERSQKGLLPAKAAAIVREIMDRPEVQSQLQINGLYKYRNYTPQDLAKDNYDATMYLHNQLSDKINQLQVDLNTAKPSERATILQAIEDNKAKVADLQKGYDQSLKAIQENPESYKTTLYQNNLSQQLVNHYSWKSESEKIIDNPLFKADMDLANYNIHNGEYNLAQKKYTTDLAHQQFMEGIESTKLKIALNKNKSAFGDVSDNVRPDNQKDAAALGSQSFQNQHKNMEEQNLNQFAQIITAASIGAKNPYTFDANGNIAGYNVKDYGTPANAQKAVQDMFVKAKESYQKGDGAYTELFKQFYDNSNYLKIVRDKESGVESNFNQQLSHISLPPDVKNMLGSKSKTYTIQNNPTSNSADILEGNSTSGISVTLSPADLIDIAQYNSVDNADVKSAIEKRLTNKLGADKFSLVTKNANQLGEYPKIVEAYNKNGALAAIVQNREQQYKDLQSYWEQHETVFSSKDLNEKKNLANTYVKQLSNYTANGDKPPGVDDVNALSQALTTGLANSRLGGYTDLNTGKSYLTVASADKKGANMKEYKIQVTPDVLQGMGVNTTDQFYQKFGRFMELSPNKTTTDVDNKGRSTALDLPGASRIRGRYSVGVHVNRVGNGYQPELYIYDKVSNKYYDKVKVDPSQFQDENGQPLPALMDGTQVMSTLSNLGEQQITQLIQAENRK